MVAGVTANAPVPGPEFIQLLTPQGERVDDPGVRFAHDDATIAANLRHMVLGRRLDKDKDNRVSREEAGAAFLVLHQRLDQNHDGYVTGDEAKAAAAARP